MNKMNGLRSIGSFIGLLNNSRKSAKTSMAHDHLRTSGGAGDVQKCSFSKAADGLTPGAYWPLREDGNTSRTPLTAFFNIPIIGLLLLSACGGPLVGVTVVDERTALENQVLGTYQELNQEVLLVASVRYIDQKGKLKKSPTVPPGKKHVIRSIQRASFNKDDIDRFKAEAILGENNMGGLTLLNPEAVTIDQRPFLDNLVKEENADREIIMLRVIETNENLSDRDLARVHKMFASLNRDKARPGEMIQLENGNWEKKEKP